MENSAATKDVKIKVGSDTEVQDSETSSLRSKFQMIQIEANESQQNIVFCADSRKEADITTEATLFHSFQPCGLDANCHANSEIAFQNMVKHKTAKSIKH